MGSISRAFDESHGSNCDSLEHIQADWQFYFNVPWLSINAHLKNYKVFNFTSHDENLPVRKHSDRNLRCD